MVQSSSAACSAISATTHCDEWQSTPFSPTRFPPSFSKTPPDACPSLPGECSLSTHSDPSGVTVPALALSITSARAMSPGSIQRCRHAGEITELGPWRKIWQGGWLPKTEMAMVISLGASVLQAWDNRRVTCAVRDKNNRDSPWDFSLVAHA